MTHEKMPEALRLAQELDSYHTMACHKLSAMELRRQNAEIERLRNALKVARMSTGFHMMHPATQAIIDAALQSTKGQL